MRVTMYGDWAKAGAVLRGLNTKLFPTIIASIDDQGELILKKLRGHISSQDLSWTPLAPRTIKMKGNDTIYVETGELSNGLGVRRIKSAKNDYSIFIGASPWKRHSPSGLKMSDLLIYLEYGTTRIPPRPLVQPTFNEVESIIKNDWEDILKQFL